MVAILAQVCALAECDVQFAPKTNWHRYCSKQHRWLGNGRIVKLTRPTIRRISQAVAEETRLAVERRLWAIARGGERDG